MLLHAFGAFENINLSCAISSKNRQPTLNKILIKSSFHCSCIQFKCKPFISAKCYRCEFYLESLECHINCYCSLLRLRNFQKKGRKENTSILFFPKFYPLRNKANIMYFRARQTTDNKIERTENAQIQTQT